MKAKESASEPSRKGRLSLGWSGKGCCEDTRKKFTFQSGVGKRRSDKNGNRGGESSGKFKLDLPVKGAPAHPVSSMRGGSASK